MRTALTLLDQTQLTPSSASRGERTLLDEVQIASPCPARWEDMTGDARSRHCQSCDKRVYDISQLTTAEALGLIRAKEGHLCLRLFRRADGRILTADCPVGLAARLERFRRRLVGPGWCLIALACALFVCLLALFSKGVGRSGAPQPAGGGPQPPVGREIIGVVDLGLWPKGQPGLPACDPEPAAPPPPQEDK